MHGVDDVTSMALETRGRDRMQHQEGGAVAVEFAVVLPLLFLILFGIIEFGIAYSKYEVYVGGAREGARYAAVNCTPDATTCNNGLIATKVAAATIGYPIGPGSPAASINCNQPTSNAGQPVTVSWTQNISINIPFWGAVTLSRTFQGVFRCE
jgi:Flp pilus assembly protein TadG